MRVLLVATLAALLLSGCTVSTYAAPSGIQGTVWIGPTCPVQRDPPDPDCADRRHETTLELTTADGVFVRRFASDGNGTYRIDVAPGNYAIRSPPEQTLPSCAAGPVTVVAGDYPTLDVPCDSGIR